VIDPELKRHVENLHGLGNSRGKPRGGGIGVDRLGHHDGRIDYVDGSVVFEEVGVSR